ncbi:hypothetical protein U9Y82_25890 [Escherichia coli]
MNKTKGCLIANFATVPSFAPLYTPKNDTLINLFQISQQEQEQLKTIISTDEAQKRRRERDRLRDEERRRAAGQLEREAYEANSLSRQKPWEAMGMSRAKGTVANSRW